MAWITTKWKATCSCCAHEIGKGEMAVYVEGKLWHEECWAKVAMMAGKRLAKQR